MAAMTTTASTPRPAAVTVAGGLAVLGALGTAALSVGHAGVELPLLSALGPGGSRAVPPAAISFAVGAVAYAAVAIGLFAGRRWAWWAGMALYVLTLVSATTPWRGVGSAAGVALALAGLAALLVPGSRRALLAG